MKAKKKKKRSFILISVLIGSLTVGIIVLGIVLISRKETSFSQKENKPENKLPEKQKPPHWEKNSECPYLNETNLITCSDSQKNIKMLIDEKKELPIWKQIPQSFIVECWKKGYHWQDILQLWEWKIASVEIPDLKPEQRIGVINSLHYLLGLPASILFDKRIPGASPYGNTRQYTQNLITFFSQQEKVNSSQYQISFLECLGIENFNKEGDVKYGTSYGKSTGNAIYLALLSAYHQKSISRSIAATGYITVKKKKAQFTNQAIGLDPGTNLLIGGIKGKTFGAVKKGIDKLVLSKWQASPFISLWDKKERKWVKCENDDYSVMVPAETRFKIKEIHWTENVQGLRDLVLRSINYLSHHKFVYE
jgi:hypothetical protein